jgi:hypothetical protein
MLNQIKNDNPFHNMLNLYFQNVYFHEMVDHIEHNKNAKQKNLSIIFNQFKPRHAIVSQEH